MVVKREMTTLGIIAGGGELPLAIAESAHEAGQSVFVLALSGADDGLSRFPREEAGLGELGKSLSLLKKHGCEAVTFAGRVSRPVWSDLKLDARGVLALPKVAAAALKGDDALMRAMLAIFEKEGFRVIGTAEAAPGLIAKAGIYGCHKPDGQAQADIAQARAVVRSMGALDIGQAAAVADGLVLAVEAAEGTDAMIARIAGLRPSLRGTPQNKRGVLVKALKPTQDGRTDLPVIGVSTVRLAAEAGLAGIAVEAGKSLVMGKAAVAAEADKLGLFVVGFAP